MKRKLQEPYLKERNLLLLPIFYYGKRHITEFRQKWQGENGECSVYCHCQYGVPGAFEQDIHAAIMRMFVLQKKPVKGIEVSYQTIADILGISARNNTTKIQKALLRLGGAKYEFRDCYTLKHGGNQPGMIQFSLFVTNKYFYKNSKGKGRSRKYFVITLPDEIIDNMQAEYYQYLDFQWLKSIPSGLPRRLYEFLEINHHLDKKKGFFAISEDKLRWRLPLNDNNPTTRRTTLYNAAQSLIRVNYLRKYFFDGKVCKFYYEDSNQEEPICETSVVSANSQKIYQEFCNWIDTIKYFRSHKKQEVLSLPPERIKEIFPFVHLEYEKRSQQGNAPTPQWIYKTIIGNGFQSKKPKSPKVADEKFNQLQLSARKITNKLQKLLLSFYYKEGYEYVKWSILYANNNAKKNYSFYLGKTLEEGWAEEWRKEETEKASQTSLKVEEDQKQRQEKQEEEKHLEQQRESFRQKVESLPQETKEDLWEKTQSEVELGVPRRKMLVKINYSKKLLNHLSNNGDVFPENVIDPLAFINEIALKKG